MNATPEIIADGEPFIPAAAAVLAAGEPLDMRYDDNARVTVETEDDEGTPVRLTYGLSQIVVSVAHYDDPDSADFTTEPDDTERIQAYGDDPGDNPHALKFDAPQGGGATWAGDDHQAHVEAWDRADYSHAEEDYIHSRGLDDAEPVPNSYDMYHVLVKAEIKYGGVYIPVWLHDKLQHDRADKPTQSRFPADLVGQYLDVSDSPRDLAGTMIREAELYQLVQAHMALTELSGMIEDELGFRTHNADKLGAGDDADRFYALEHGSEQ